MANQNANPPDPTGNVADLINNLFGKQSDAINKFSSIIGAVADASAVGSVVVGFVNTIINLFQPQSDPLQPILDALEHDFGRLYADLNARFNEIDWQTLAIEVSSAESEVEILPGLIDAQPPLTDTDRLGHISVCLSPLNALSDVSHPPATFFSNSLRRPDVLDRPGNPSSTVLPNWCRQQLRFRWEYRCRLRDASTACAG